MLLDADDLLDAFERFAQKKGANLRLDRRVLVSALTEAERLAQGDAKDAPAALFVALAQRSSKFVPVAETFIATAVRAQAIALGFELVAESIEFTVLRAGILRSEVTFAHLRPWFAKRLRPVAPSL